MFTTNVEEQIKRLNFEEFLWILFAILSIANVVGDYNEQEFLETNDTTFEEKSNKIFEITLIITFFIYIYFFIRNFNAFKNASEEEKQLYTIKVLGSSFLIAGIICLIYFQFHQTSFVGSPAI